MKLVAKKKELFEKYFGQGGSRLNGCNGAEETIVDEENFIARVSQDWPILRFRYKEEDHLTKGMLLQLSAKADRVQNDAIKQRSFFKGWREQGCRV